MLRPIRRHTRNCGNYGKWDVDCPSKTKLKCPLIVVRYEMGPGRTHPLEGLLAPDLRVRTTEGSARVAELMRAGRAVLLDFTPGSRAAGTAADWDDLVMVVTATPPPSAPADALLVRPDGYVAWAVGPDTDRPVANWTAATAAGLTQALCRWVRSGGGPGDSDTVCAPGTTKAELPRTPQSPPGPSAVAGSDRQPGGGRSGSGSTGFGTAPP